MKLETKTFSAEVKAVAGEPGTFEALVSVFGNKDLGGDVVMPGAFTETLASWAAKGDPIPVIWSHDWGNPQAHIGAVTSAVETDRGLLVRAQLDVDRNFAEQVHHLMKSRRVTQFSFGYFADEVKWAEDETGRMFRELHKISLFEVGPTLLGMNPETELIQAASATSTAAADHGGSQAKEIDDSVHPVTSRQVALYEALEGVVRTFGKFDQTTGPDGAHYVSEAANPFTAEGMVCSSCVFYEGPQACEIVAGDIEPGAICKWWTIPADLMSGTQSASGHHHAGAKSTEETSDDSEGDISPTVASERSSVLLHPDGIGETA